MVSWPSITAFTVGCFVSAYADAFTKADMKPILMPCFFTKASWLSFLSCMMADMSSSLKVVNIALVFCASFSLLAIFNLILFIFTLCSLLVPAISVVGSAGGILSTGAAGAAGRGGGGGGVVGIGAAAAAGAAGAAAGGGGGGGGAAAAGAGAAAAGAAAGLAPPGPS